MRAPRVAVIGAGSLARALLAGWAAAGTEFTAVTTVNKTADSARTTAASKIPSGTDALSIEDDPDAVRSAVGNADVVLVAVKPHMVEDLLTTLSSAWRAGTIVVSVAAGVRTSTFTAALPDGVHVVRAMPNTPCAVRTGVVGLVPDPTIPADVYDTVRGLFDDLGHVVEVPEDQLDGIVAISGSGPAYVFLLVDKLRDAAIAQGFDPATASALSRQVFRGAVALMDGTGEEPAELRRKVTSPNGTTARAVQTFEDGGLGDLIDAAVRACRQRAQELGA